MTTFNLVRMSFYHPTRIDPVGADVTREADELPDPGDGGIEEGQDPRSTDTEGPRNLRHTAHHHSLFA